ncbi:putative porin superfamily protein [Citrobacter phage CVT22]|uniref:Porin superfamily protein n=1 Tax=Citrobacter phage CVT22 TaxID=1622234 RepID=A0A0R6BA21_9CAUD|nr:putative porin superfamily protein [Citrobacter phage CVT22]AJT60711.1 putative porin superfamily protein [Citrobacter phage CVT22]
MSEELFSQSAATTAPPAEPVSSPSASTYADLLGSIKNEQGVQKYATIEEALKGLANAQEYIPQVKTQLSAKEQELADLRAELEKRKAVEDVIASLQPKQPEPVVEPTSQPSQGLSAEDVQRYVEQALNQSKAQDIQTSNTSKVRSALVSKYGEKAQEVATARATELGMSMADLNKLAASSPDAALALLGASAPVSTGAPVRSSVSLPDVQRTVSLAPEKSLMRGATTKDLVAYMDKLKQAVKQQHGFN